MSFIYCGEPPELFNPAFEACGCFVEHEAQQIREGDDEEVVTKNLQILLLLRQDHKSEPNVWGVPGGKLHLGQVRHEWTRFDRHSIHHRFAASATGGNG